MSLSFFLCTNTEALTHAQSSREDCLKRPRNREVLDNCNVFIVLEASWSGRRGRNKAERSWGSGTCPRPPDPVLAAASEARQEAPSRPTARAWSEPTGDLETTQSSAGCQLAEGR